jgi:tRNA A-37 threonylcarbamoyl transferase component Bud32
VPILSVELEELSEIDEETFGISMGQSSFKRVSTRGFRGWVREELFDLLSPSFFKDPVSSIQKMGGEVITQSKWRWSAILSMPNGAKLFFKMDRTKGWVEALKYFLFPSKGRREWFIAYQLEKRNLDVPKPLGWMERVHRGLVKESYYLSAAIGSGVSLIEDPARLKENVSIIELAKTVRRIHHSGLLHRDLHAGNFLWDGETFFLTDLHRASILKSLSLNQRLWNLSHLFHSLRSLWGEEEQARFIEKYFEEGTLGPKKKEEYLQKVRSRMDHLRKRQWKSRTRRCLKESTEFSIKKEKEAQYYHRRDFPLGQVKELIEEHLHIVKEKPSALTKHSAEVKVSLFKKGENRVCVKQFCYPYFWNRFKELLRHSKGLKSWRAANGLRTRGIPSLLPLALMERRHWWGLKESFFIMGTLETDREMDRYILAGFEGFHEKRLFIKGFTQWLSKFHKMNIYHKDMKICNILVSENGEAWDFHLLDLEDIQLDEEVDERKLFKNFLQLNTSTPKVMTRIDRYRFLKEYLHLNPIVKNQRAFLQRLTEESRRRGLVYVSPEGVVVGKL